MAKIVRSGQSGALDHIDSSQATFRSQIAALTDAVRQLGGNAQVGAGTTVNDPLNAPYVLYVNPSTGDDTFIGGEYSSGGTADERIALQRLECGYTQARPFKTINRAVIEAGIITAKSYYVSPLTNNDLVSIVLMPGVYTIHNAPGKPAVAEWPVSKNPTDAELTEFNSQTTGGVLLPRGVSLCGLDLRKTIFRPDSVPAVDDEAADSSNRRAIFKVTGTGYYFGFTFMDKAGSKASHHLLHAFEFASKAELDEFYGKIAAAFGGPANTGGLDLALAVTQPAEYEIVGPQPAPGAQTETTDTTLSASPYIFNCSIRSNYGLCGVYADGAKTSGFRSLVTAQFTGVSLQRDLSCWQKYDPSKSSIWDSANFANYADYIATPPDNVRMAPARRSFHIKAVNNAVIQEVSVFAIGQGVHHWTTTGGEITITNSNSNFGGCAAISEGYRATANAADKDWTVGRIRVADNLSGKANNVQRIYLGTVSAVTSSTITLVDALGESVTYPGVPDLVAAKGYSLRSGSYVWVENPLGSDWRSTFTAAAWDKSAPAVLKISAPLSEEGGAAVPVVNGTSSAVNKRLYIRRVLDTRSPDERRFSLILNNTAPTARVPVRDYALQVDTNGTSINGEIPLSTTLTVGQAGKLPNTGAGVVISSEVVLRRANALVEWTAGTRYQRGETVRHNSKHYTCVRTNSDTTFTASDWDESYVHMPSDYRPEDWYKTEFPILVFDNDTSGAEVSTTLGYNFATVWSTDAAVQAQYRNAADYRGAHLLLTALGFSAPQADEILTPRPSAVRDLDPSKAADMGGHVPVLAANALDNWPVQFRRPSVIRLFGHAWEWAGYLNYTKSIPIYQGELSAQNKFTSYFTNVNGGRVYATGFNEEGFQVSPRGLEDITTGTTLTVDNIGANDLELATPTEFTDLTLNGTTDINGTLDLSEVNVIKLPPIFAATTTNPGVGTIASLADLDSAPYPTSDAAINSNGAKLINPAGMIYLGDQRYAPRLSATDRRRFVLPTGSGLPSGATSYPLLNGGTIDLNGVKTYPTLAAAYASLPDQFVLPEGATIDIYLLSNTIELGSYSGTPVVGSSDPAKLTRIMPLHWDQNTTRQIIKYTIPFNYGGAGPFQNVIFTAENVSGVPVLEGRTKLEVKVEPSPAGTDPGWCGVVGANIKSTNLWVEITKNTDDAVAFPLFVFRGFTGGPYTTWRRNNEYPSYLKVSLEGAGKQVTNSDSNGIYGYDLVVFTASKDQPVQYGACMMPTSLVASTSDEDKRKATALYEFVNNRPATVKVLFHYINASSKLAIDGAAYTGWTTNLTWRLSGSNPWSWRLFGFYKSFDQLSGEQASNVEMEFTGRGLVSQAWGGFINGNSSTRWFSAIHSPGPFTNCSSASATWGIFGAHNAVAITDSLLGGDVATGYYLRPDPARFNIVIPPK